jgi:AcrR family transcriptional regulator
MSRSSQIANRRAALRKSGQLEYATKRKEIVSIAAKIFKQKGFHSTNINSIAEEAGIDRASLYYYVSGKDELFKEVVFEATVKNVEFVEIIAGSDAAPLDKIRQIILGMMKAFRDQYPYMFVFVQEEMGKIADDSKGRATEMRSLGRRFDKSVIAIIQSGLDDGTIRPLGEARLIAFGIIGMLNWSHRWFRPDRGYSAETVGTTYADMVISGLAGQKRRRQTQ